MVVKFKVFYFKDGKEEKILGVKYDSISQVLEELFCNGDVSNIRIQEYPLKEHGIVNVNPENAHIQIDKGRKHIVSFSGGKDSTAMLIRMLELGERVDRIIFADTKFEFEEMYEYIEKVEEYIQKRFDPSLNIEVLRTEDTLEEWMFGKVTRGKREGETRGFPMTVFPCYWSRVSKIQPMNKVMRGHYRYIGIAIDEKHRASDDSNNLFIKYPLIEWGWTEQDCVDYLNNIDLMNPLYRDGVTRTGCWWCPKQSIAAWKVLYNNHIDKMEQIVEWEDKMGEPISTNYSAKELIERFRIEDLE